MPIFQNGCEDQMSEDGRLRIKQIRVWLTELELEKAKDKVAYCKITMSEYIRKIINDGVIIKRDYSGVSEINRIGLNINQISRKVNEVGSISKQDFEDLKLQYNELFAVVYDKILSE